MQKIHPMFHKKSTQSDDIERQSPEPTYNHNEVLSHAYRKIKTNDFSLSHITIMTTETIKEKQPKDAKYYKAYQIANATCMNTKKWLKAVPIINELLAELNLEVGIKEHRNLTRNFFFSTNTNYHPTPGKHRTNRTLQQ